MNNEKQALGPLQEQWLQELESGKHKQGTAALRRNDDYCCLGVACEFVLKIEPFKLENGGFSFSGEEAVMSVGDFQKLGLGGQNGNIDYRYMDEFHLQLELEGYRGFIRGSLAKYNDSGVTFAQLAKAIRACPHAVFVEPK